MVMYNFKKVNKLEHGTWCMDFAETVDKLTVDKDSYHLLDHLS